MLVGICEMLRRWSDCGELTTVVVNCSITVERSVLMLDRLRDIVRMFDNCRPMEMVRNVVFFGADDREVWM